MTKHTRGPWRLGDAGQTIFGPKTEHPSPVIIATIHASNTNRLPQDVAKANALLIAAAPELLEALAMCQAWFEKFSPTADTIAGGAAEHPMLYSIRKTIKKAKGE